MVAGVGIAIGLVLAGMTGEPASQRDADSSSPSRAVGTLVETTSPPQKEPEERLVAFVENQKPGDDGAREGADAKYKSLEDAMRAGAAYLNLKVARAL